MVLNRLGQDGAKAYRRTAQTQHVLFYRPNPTQAH